MPVVLEEPKCPGRGAVVTVTVKDHGRIVPDAGPSEKPFQLRQAGNVARHLVFQVDVKVPTDRSGDMALTIASFEIRIDFYDRHRLVVQMLGDPVSADQYLGVGIGFRHGYAPRFCDTRMNIGQ
jgi:hypothetical protein